MHTPTLLNSDSFSGSHIFHNDKKHPHKTSSHFRSSAVANKKGVLELKKRNHIFIMLNKILFRSDTAGDLSHAFVPKVCCARWAGYL